MKKFSLSSVLIGLMALFCLLVPLAADSGDIWALPSNVWRVNSSGHLIPGTTNVSDFGTSSNLARAIYSTDVQYTSEKLVPTTVTANATLTTLPRIVYIGSLNANRTYIIPAPTVGAVVEFQDTAGNVNVNGNVTIDAGSGKTINGSQTKVISTTYGGLKLHGVSTTAWAAR